MPDYAPSLQGIDEKRAAIHNAIDLTGSKLPQSFPSYLWNRQQSRYYEYWAWFNGDRLNEVKGKTQGGEDVLKFPLGVNPVRSFARKHAAFLIGEDNLDSPLPPIRSKVKALKAIDGGETNELDKKLAILAQNIINEVWAECGGRGLQSENAVLSQFLGGCVFQVCWQPERDDLRIPIIIRNIPPDFFLPVWSETDKWNLLEAYVIYKIPTAVAEQQYGIGNSGSAWSIYVEHWTRKSVTITVDGKPISERWGDVEIEYSDHMHGFGFVPFVYIPHLREGNFFGSSHVDDMIGLIKEYNARLADLGDSIRTTVKRKRFGSNLGNMRVIDIGEGTTVHDLGKDNPTSKHPPEITTEDPPNLSVGLTAFPETLWKQILREGYISDIAYGEDEGSQRSALTLAFRMWPSTSHSRMERAFWTDGMNLVAKMIIRMCLSKYNNIKAIQGLDRDVLSRISISQDWLPQVPRDREQLVNETILRFQSGLSSLEAALENFGDIQYIDEEIERIQKLQIFKASLQGPASSEGGAKEEINTPVAADGLDGGE